MISTANCPSQLTFTSIFCFSIIRYQSHSHIIKIVPIFPKKRKNLISWINFCILFVIFFLPRYVTETFRTDAILNPEYHRIFRLTIWWWYFCSPQHLQDIFELKLILIIIWYDIIHLELISGWCLPPPSLHTSLLTGFTIWSKKTKILTKRCS